MEGCATGQSPQCVCVPWAGGKKKGGLGGHFVPAGTSVGIVDVPGMVLDGLQSRGAKGKGSAPGWSYPFGRGNTPSSNYTGATPPSNRHTARNHPLVLWDWPLGWSQSTRGHPMTHNRRRVRAPKITIVIFGDRRWTGHVPFCFCAAISVPELPNRNGPVPHVFTKQAQAAAMSFTKVFCSVLALGLLSVALGQQGGYGGDGERTPRTRAAGWPPALPCVW